MVKRVLLVAPPTTRPRDMLDDKVRVGVVAPLGLAYIGAMLEREGYEVRILDCVAAHQNPSPYGQETRYGLSDSEIEGLVTDYAPDLVGVSCLFSNLAFDAHNVCRIVKQVNQRIVTVMGGSHPTALMTETLRDSNVDVVVQGEGEDALLAICRGEPMPRGVVDLNTLPLPARHLLDMPKYLYSESPHSGLKRTPVANISTSRGCPSRCSFCAIRGTFGKAFRPRSSENVLNEIDHLISTYKIKELDFEDDNLTAQRLRAMAIFQGIIDRKYDLSLNSPSGLAVFALEEALLDKMKEAGYYSISLAIESGSPWVLKELIHKHVDLVKAKRMVAYGRSIGLKVKVFAICGYPGETKESMAQTVDYFGNLGADWVCPFPATALPGTELDKRVRANGWLVDPYQDPRYLFFKPNIRTDQFTPDDVLRMKEDMNAQINFYHNTNYVEGRYDVALADFEEVHSLYPGLEIAKEMINKCQEARGNVQTIQ